MRKISLINQNKDIVIKNIHLFNVIIRQKGFRYLKAVAQTLKNLIYFIN